MENLGRVVLLMGGVSSEREVSLMSGEGVHKALVSKGVDVLKFDPKTDSLETLEKGGFDRAFIALHGRLGEDGTIQGVLNYLGIPYTGPGVTASAMAIDKDLTKQLLTYHGIRNTKYVVVTPENQSEYTYEKCAAELGETLFVKPARQGSSVGIYKVSNKEEFDKAIQDGFHYDFKILVEETIANPREVECSVLGNRDIKASKLGAIRVPAEDAFYDYNNKFVDASGVVFEIPVELPENLTKEIQQMSLDAFRVLGNRGLARMDFLVDENDVPYFGEVNTLPGFTNISLYPQLWAVSGINYKDLLDRLIQLAFDEFEDNAKLHYDFVELGSEKLGKGLLTDEDKK